MALHPPTQHAMAVDLADHPRRRWPVTLWLGAGLIVVCELLLLIDVQQRGVAVLPPQPGQGVTSPGDLLGHLARWVALNMTPLCWVGYLLVMDGVLTCLARRREGEISRPESPARSRPRRFIIAVVVSVGVWVFFDWVNFSYIHAWQYHGVETLSRAHQYIAKFIAFGAICPAMFLAAQLYQRLGLRRCRTAGLPIGRRWQIIMVLLGVPAFLFPFLVREPIGCVTLWVSVVLLLDPVNHWLGAPSLIGDWQAGRWGRTASLMLGGLTCGVLWEFWNYWAAAKWTYTLPFLGPFEQYKAFEMPLLGFLGFLPFALECWVAFQTILLLMQKMRLPLAEPIPDADTLL
ncbi:MAG: hypothetical protein O7D97_10425 [Planctomycetota bacterium]|nr:hypothetical protein [Planctomycetota bacterium]